MNDAPKPRDPAPYVEAAREIAAIEESVTLSPMTVYLSRGKCPHCGSVVRVRLRIIDATSGRVAMPSIECPHCDLPFYAEVERIEAGPAEVLPLSGESERPGKPGGG